jgi:transposase InsO family protein
MTRQNFYKTRRRREIQALDGHLIKRLVLDERASQPRLGGRKLLKILGPKLNKQGIYVGRDRFFKVLKRQGLLVEKLPSSPRTTNSYHNLPIFLNRVKDKTLTGSNQAWAADITYLRKRDTFMYLSLITDMYSRKIVGYHLGESLDTTETLKALKMALRNKPKEARPIHHSDRGCQYCSHEYVRELKGNGLVVSMTEQNHCSENALAERVNGILKQEYGLGYRFNSAQQMHKAVKQAVWLYNTRRPHSSLDLETPEHIHRIAA